MLYLESPDIIDGVAIYKDHADPLLFYYLPGMPHLTTANDEKRTISPQIQIIKFRGKAGNGGFLNFDVNLGIDEDTLESIASKMRSRYKLKERPRMSPLPVIDGSVKMILFDMQSGDQPAADPTKLKFVSKIYSGSKPSLYGDNQAVFSVSLEQAGVTILEKAILGEMSPIAIIYSLDFLGLRPAYTVRCRVDWDRVQKHIEEKHGLDLYVVSIDIQKIVDELIENRTIVIEAETYVPEGDDAGTVIADKNKALEEVRAMVTNAFFQPSLEPYKDEKDGSQKAADTFAAIVNPSNTIATSVIKYSYKKVDYTRIDKKVLNANISERTTVRRTIYPQGHLRSMLKDIPNINDYIIAVDLDDKWFTRRKIDVLPRANFEEDSIYAINAKLRYGNEPKNVILDSMKSKGSVDWSSIIENDTMKWDVIGSYEINFKDAVSAERPVSIKSPEQVITDEIFEINPRKLYSVLVVPIQSVAFPWARCPNVEVHVKYEDPANKINISEVFLLKKDDDHQLWKVFMLDDSKRTLQYRIIYHFANEKNLDNGWQQTTEDQILVRSPFSPDILSINIIPNLDWSVVNRAIIDLTYADKGSGILENGSFTFSEKNSDDKVFSVNIKNREIRIVEYSIALIYKNSKMVNVPRSITRQNRIILYDGMKAHRLIRVSPAPVDFSGKNLQDIKVEMRYSDISKDLSYADVFVFKSPENVAYFEYDFADEQNARYEYRVTYSYTNGMSRTADWKGSNADDLNIEVE